MKLNKLLNSLCFFILPFPIEFALRLNQTDNIIFKVQLKSLQTDQPYFRDQEMNTLQ